MIDQILNGLLPAAKLLVFSTVGTAVIVVPILMNEYFGWVVSLIVFFLFLAYKMG